MATITGSTQYLSAHFAYYITWVEDQVNATNNTSRVTAYVYVQKIGSYSIESIHNNHYLYIDGTAFNANNYVDMNPETTPRLLVSGSKTITHNSDGSKSITISSNGEICHIDPRPSYTPYTGSASGTATLTTISRASAVSTQSASSISTTQATANGTVTDVGIPNITDRGIYWGTSSGSQPNKLSEGGTGASSFNRIITGLKAGTTYYYKAYSYNSSYGYRYGSVVSFTTLSVAPTVTTQSCANIDTHTATANGNITATGGATVTRRGFCYIEGSSGTPTVLDLTQYEDGSFGTGAFSLGLTGLKAGTNHRVRAYAINSQGTSYGAVVDLETLGVEDDAESGLYISGIQDITEDRGLWISGGIEEDAERGLYIHGSISVFEDMKLYMNVVDGETADMGLWIDGIADGYNLYKNLRFGLDNSALRNRIYVRGGTYLSDTIEISQVADGEQTVFYLPEKPHDIAILEGATSKTVGIKNIHSFDDYDYLVNYQEKYVETDVAPSSGTVMTFTYKYDIPILVAVEDQDSIEANGQFEYVIFDKSITTVSQARSRAVAELEDYAESITSGTFETLETGFRAGQYIMVDIPEFGIDGKFVVKGVKATSIGGGQFKYDVSIVSSELLGIIRFLVDMLESNKNALNISTDEVVDEITTITGESFTLNEGTPVITSHDGDYKYDSDADWDIGSFS